MFERPTEVNVSAGPTQSLPGGDARRWVSIAAAGALACALSPLLPLLSIAPWEVVTVTPYVAVVLAAVTLVATRAGEDARPQRAMAIAALAALAVWVGLFVLMCVELLYGG
jgi:TctA family transporter